MRVVENCSDVGVAAPSDPVRSGPLAIKCWDASYIALRCLSFHNRKSYTVEKLMFRKRHHICPPLSGTDSDYSASYSLSTIIGVENVGLKHNQAGGATMNMLCSEWTLEAVIPDIWVLRNCLPRKIRYSSKQRVPFSIATLHCISEPATSFS